MPGAAKSTAEQGFKTQKDAWRAAAATPQGKEGLKTGCKMALESLSQNALCKSTTDARVARVNPGRAHRRKIGACPGGAAPAHCSSRGHCGNGALAGLARPAAQGHEASAGDPRLGRDRKGITRV